MGSQDTEEGKKNEAPICQREWQDMITDRFSENYIASIFLMFGTVKIAIKLHLKLGLHQIMLYKILLFFSIDCLLIYYNLYIIK